MILIGAGFDGDADDAAARAAQLGVEDVRDDLDLTNGIRRRRDGVSGAGGFPISIGRPVQEDFVIAATEDANVIVSAIEGPDGGPTGGTGGVAGELEDVFGIGGHGFNQALIDGAAARRGDVIEQGSFAVTEMVSEAVPS